MVIASNRSSLAEEAGEKNYLNQEPFPIVTLQGNASQIRCFSGRGKQLAQANVIEKLQSPWRALVVVLKIANHKKKQMWIFFFTTVNWYTVPDAYHVPVIAHFL